MTSQIVTGDCRSTNEFKHKEDGCFVLGAVLLLSPQYLLSLTLKFLSHWLHWLSRLHHEVCKWVRWQSIDVRGHQIKPVRQFVKSACSHVPSESPSSHTIRQLNLIAWRLMIGAVLQNKRACMLSQQKSRTSCQRVCSILEVFLKYVSFSHCFSIFLPTFKLKAFP